MNSADIDRIFERKIKRLSEGESPRVLDLFSGCGGISLGFELAGCDIIGGVELDRHASMSHAINFHKSLSEPLFEKHATPKDITKTTPCELVQLYGHKSPKEQVDILVGGPPCPAFARVGRAKLREVHEHPEAFRHDPRAKLYLPYLDYVEELKPVAILMENVPDILNYGGHNLAEEICEVLEEINYKCAYTLLNSANYGVPQMRERFFLIGIHKSIDADIAFPIPTRYVNFPRGYKGSRQVALKHIQQDTLFAQHRYTPSPVPPAQAGDPVSVCEAIEDLPPITAHLNGTMKRGARRFDTAVSYRRNIVPSSYAMFMRSWPGHESDGFIWDHVTRSLSDRDYRLFREMNEGDDYPKAHELAQKLLAQAVNGTNLKSSEYESLRAQYVPPYDPGKFPNKWRKMESDEPARTLMAHLGKDSYSHIHYDSAQARVLSVREAARLQSFPDGFTFSGTMNPAFRQIGNAVPPLIAFSLARQILQSVYAQIGSPNVSVLREKVSEFSFLADDFTA